ncbi:MAG: hypothetical protein K2N28_00030 [Muribaculaceae bacterium]|nr:hypothetical protein [Muribaculaceae bacterium]
MKHLLLYLTGTIALIISLTGCIEDGFTNSPSDRPHFSVDTLALGTLFTAEGSPTYEFKVFNPYSKSLNISRIALRDDAESHFRLNVDGVAGREFTDIEVRAKDSIFVFVEVTLPDLDLDHAVDYKRHLDFTTNGVTETVVITATALDAARMKAVTIDTDRTLTAARPYIIYDSLVVAPGATLTLEPGTKLHFHDGAELRVHGSLHADGSPGDGLIEMTGDRWGNVVGRVDYEIMSGQWEGVMFTPTSRGNRMAYTSVRNTNWGVVVDSVPYDDATPSLSLHNCQLRNSKEYALLSSFSSIRAWGCELADASSGVVALQGGHAELVNCTIANYYLFSVLGGPALQLYHASPDDAIPGVDLPLLSATVDNCIIYGNGFDLSHADLNDTDVYIRRTLLKSEGTDDDHFIGCIWDKDPLYGTIREDYHFDYRLHPESPAIAAADPALMPATLTDDIDGAPRHPNPTLGAYATILPE